VESIAESVFGRKMLYHTEWVSAVLVMAGLPNNNNLMSIGNLDEPTSRTISQQNTTRLHIIVENV
jgi:hypothetical protein